ncbi:hypothetical protein MBELCI_2697 [Limimaricola cinnabarinus LL-001]|uniref:Uncharacterized protein n=1 Tax=Limimaricola cinnabarinus LL-001 TaxID=1337093 RepID=U2Z5D8_9RHOB|nr:hypothetical protein MBELCI_2697 [Limimaricola cinnabarinus LL-001]
MRLFVAWSFHSLELTPPNMYLQVMMMFSLHTRFLLFAGNLLNRR